MGNVRFLFFSFPCGYGQMDWRMAFALLLLHCAWLDVTIRLGEKSPSASAVMAAVIHRLMQTHRSKTPKRSLCSTGYTRIWQTRKDAY